MDTLLPGITGFWSQRKDSPPSETNTHDFVSYCHSVAHQLNGKVTSKSLRSYPRNYHVASLQLASQTLSVLLNAHQPYLAVAKPWKDRCLYPDLIDLPCVADEFRKFGCYILLSKDELGAPVTDEAIANLSSAEKGEIQYWNPDSIGEVLFNAWD